MRAAGLAAPRLLHSGHPEWSTRMASLTMVQRESDLAMACTAVLPFDVGKH
jgi:hypothetical protein